MKWPKATPKKPNGKSSDPPVDMVEATHKFRSFADPLGYFLTELFHFLGLFAIGGAAVWAGIQAFAHIITQNSPNIEDLLLLFIYLEIGSMVGIYFKTNRMPVRFLIYVGITAVTRHLIGYVQHTNTADVGLLFLAGATLILAFAVFVIRYTSFHYPDSAIDDSSGEPDAD